MSNIELTEKFFMEAAGWQTMKEARGLLASDRVLSSSWKPPLLRGVVSGESTSYRAGLVIQGKLDIENLCSCRQARQLGTLCAHSVAVGLHYLKPPRAAQSAEKENVSKPAKKQIAKDVRQIHRCDTDEAGEPLEICVVFPPNLEQAIQAGKVTLFFQGRWSRGQVPLDSLPMNQSFQLEEEDLALLNEVELIAGGDTPGMLQLNNVDFINLLNLLIGHLRLSLGKSKAIRVDGNPWYPPLQCSLEETGEIRIELKPGHQLPTVVLGSELWAFMDSEFRPLGLPAGCLPVLQGPMTMKRGAVPQFMGQAGQFLNNIDAFDCNFDPSEFRLETSRPRFILNLQGGLAKLKAQLQCAYGPRILTLGSSDEAENVWIPDPKNFKRYSTRNLTAEKEALHRVLRYGFNGPDTNGWYQLSGQDRVLEFFAREYRKLEKEWEVELEERLEWSTQKHFEHIEPTVAISSSGMQWFDFSVTYTGSDGSRFSPAEIQRLLISGRGHKKLKSGKIAIFDNEAVEELQEVLKDCSPEQGGGVYQVSPTQAGFLDATFERNGWAVQAPEEWRQRSGNCRGVTEMAVPDLGEMDGLLRAYQKTGVAWLAFLRENGFGGILADEMGLGKTLQVLALIASLKAKTVSTPPAPVLVVCPTSVVYNWFAEAQRFAPDLKVLVIHGAGRKRMFSEMSAHDLVVTSYALVRRDMDHYKSVEFDSVVLDEAQHIKNRQTQNAKSVKSIRTRHRLVLTGTPMENSVLDLWSIFDFLMPGYLGAEKDFKERYELPITRERNVEVQARLGRRLRPFVLRRTKKEVAPELPDKIEQITYCELTPKQRQVYQQIMDVGRKEVLEAVGAKGLAKSRMMVLTTLLRLRQVCCDVRLLQTELRDRDGGDSGKLEMFGELLEEIIDGNHRVLVFSQFVKMLTILRTQLGAEGVQYCYLDGGTRNRAEVVSIFQNSTVPVFLISLKAGGTGLNLTGADTVIHFDPWWNPAIEDQATDRTHRIGQTKTVTSYKLIARDTVEEKIQILQQTKREIIKGTVGSDEAVIQSLSWEEIQSLFE